MRTASIFTIRSGAARTGRRARGLSLIEIMIALAIGAILSLVAGQIFISAKEGYRTNDALARIQENARYAISFLRRDIRSADFWGCAGNALTSSTVQNGPVFPGPGVSGTDNNPGPDEVTLEGALNGTTRNVTQQMPNTAANIFMNNSTGIASGDILVVTDCQAADSFMVTDNNINNSNVQHNSGVVVSGISNTTQQLSRAYGLDARVLAARQVTYSINGDSELVRTINGASTTTLVPDIPGMEITYGTDVNNDKVVDMYVPATAFPDVDGDGVNDWESVLAVRIALLVRSEEDGITGEPQTDIWDFNEDGTLDDAPDDRMYQRFNATISLRNRLP